MPIFEYECARCGLVSSHVVMGSSRRRERPGCPQCKSARMRRGVLSVAAVGGAAARVSRFRASKACDDVFYWHTAQGWVGGRKETAREGGKTRSQVRIIT